ncbi:GNAT family N-acetyltransferase [Clostridium manihotivorum]|uniref:GNAT family N-acetyltransferase n=1 Tax=Clostridium manihotivorum TaxID=2320868 RepID=A0A410DTE3_9CLOT|nr:GNAT family N-acetyltransferase [Clostridium manihotivorum]QAA32311.1 GNAT family N-acetyltransferase [Clostridium manihotivorum]
MLELLSEERQVLSRFRKEKTDVTIWSCIEGKMGKAWADNNGNPTFGIAVVADFCYLLGSIEGCKGEVSIEELIEKCKRKIIIADDSSWISFIESQYPNPLKRFSRYSIKTEPDLFKKDRLNDYINAIDSDFKISRIDESLYPKVLQDNFMADCCSNYDSLEEFLNNGLGYAIVYNGQIIAGASSYSYCEGCIEITIGTKDEYRRKGLALAVASKLILACMERNIYPHWDAANLGSVALAEKLGYHFDKEYRVYAIK